MASPGPRLTQRGAAFVTSGVILLAAGVLLGQPDLTRIGVLLLALIAMVLTLAAVRPTAFQVQRSVAPGRISVDELARVRVTLSNESARSTAFALAEETLDPVLGDRPRFVLPATPPRSALDVDYFVRPHQRGRYELGPLLLSVRDPFGLTSIARPTEGAGTVLVAPKAHPLASERVLGRGIGAEGSVPHQVALHGEDDQSIREFREGDDLRRIHWPATARTGSIMVRQEDRPARRRAMLLLDSRRTVGLRGPEAREGRTSSGLEWSVTMAASIAAHVADLGYAVHLLTPDPRSELGVRLDDDRESMLDTLAEIALSPDDGWGPLLHAAHGMAKGGGLLVVLTAGLAEEDARALATLRQPGSTALAFVVQEVIGHPARTVADTTVAVLGAAGWRAATVHPQDGPARCWAQVTTVTHELVHR